MRKDTWLKVAAAIWILSALGGVIALAKGAQIAAVAESVGNLWLLLALLFGKRIAMHFPKQRSEIAFGVAISATALGVGSVFRYSTEHVAVTLMMVGIFLNMAADLLAGGKDDFLKSQNIADIYRYFKAGGEIRRSPLERALSNGGGLLLLASIVSLFTITTW
jgi:hypothetical protein